MNRILLLLENKKNRELLAGWLHSRYEIILPLADPSLSVPFDLCLIDGPMLDRTWQQVQERKQSEQPLFLPFVLITPRQDVDMVTRHLWTAADELIHLPVEKLEMQARIEVLMRTRKLSVDLKLRNEDQESFLHAMTHDLRAPLRAVLGFAEAILEDDGPALSPRSTHYARTIIQASQQMQELIDALLGFSRIGREEIELQPVKVELILESCLRQAQLEIERTGAQITTSSALPTVWANPILLKIALNNLLTNAMKFVTRSTVPLITVAAEQREDRARITIQDNGIGIAEQNQSQIFTPFMQLHGVEEYAGVGLGLATVHKAIELMRGQVGVSSRTGEGSTFWIELYIAGEDTNALSRD